MSGRTKAKIVSSIFVLIVMAIILGFLFIPHTMLLVVIGLVITALVVMVWFVISNDIYDDFKEDDDEQI